MRGGSAHHQRTIYNRCGDAFGWTCVVIVIPALAWSCRPKRRKQSR
jgi:hypothetical protein